MNVDVILYAGAVTPERVSGRSVAVIDVFRATSVEIEALHNGARAIVPVVTVQQALQICGRYGRADALLGGERRAVKIEGFDLDNSPRSYTRETVEGKTIVQSTTNGTRAIFNSSQASGIFIAAFVNMSAAAEALASAGRDVTLVCAGRQDRYTAEDGLCAGGIAGMLRTRYGAELTDIAQVMERQYSESQHDLKESLSTTLHYNDMLSLGFEPDIDFCLQRDIYDIVPAYGGVGEITI